MVSDLIPLIKSYNKIIVEFAWNFKFFNQQNIIIQHI